MHSFLGPSDPKLTHSIPRRPFIFKTQPTPKQPEETVRRDKKKGAEEIPGLRHFG
jgi:hypothetical protein